MSADGLLLFFASTRVNGNLNIFSSSRATVDDPWPTATIVGDGTVSTPGTEYDPVISGDGLTLYFTRLNEILVATRPTRDDPFGDPQPIAELNSGPTDVVSSVSYDGLTLTFHSTRNSGQGSDTFLATRSAIDQSWTVVPMPGAVNGPDNEADSFMWNDRLTLFFNSDRSGDFDIYVATRGSEGEPFGSPSPLAELNTADVEGDLWLSPDGRTALFIRGPNLLNLDIYEARR